MTANHPWRKLPSVISILILGVSMNACSMFGSTTTWKEEVLLHDGTTMIVTRSQTRSGASEIGQGPPITEHSIIFTPAGSKEPIIWKARSTIQEGHVDFDLLALDIVQGTPYLATWPRGCFVYGKLGRPNPPYIFFRYADQQWKKIPLQEFPVEIKQPNVVIDLYSLTEIKSAEKKTGFVSTASIKEINSSLREDEFKTIHRQPRSGKGALLVNCPSYSDLRIPKASPTQDGAEREKDVVKKPIDLSIKSTKAE